jgi:hypothetical protein
MDSASVEAGDDRREQIFANVATCKTFVALLSEPYLHRGEWCAKEWDLFSRRRRVARQHGSIAILNSGIIPVLWAPMVSALPDRIRSIQRFMPNESEAELYQREGLLGIKMLDRDVYKAIVWKIARAIYIVQASTAVEPLSGPLPTDLSRTFD